MKRWVPLSLIILAGLLAIATTEWRQVDTRPSPEAILSAAADGQHELTRMPNKLDRMSDEDEMRIGDELAPSYEARWQATTAESKATAIRIQSYRSRSAKKSLFTQNGSCITISTTSRSSPSSMHLPCPAATSSWVPA